MLPPTSLLILTIVGALLLRRAARARTDRWYSASQLLLLALSLPVVASALARSLEPATGDGRRTEAAQAIVILAGGNSRGSPEWGGETVKTYTLLATALRRARLARETGLPIYVTRRHSPRAVGMAEATLMRDVLVKEYQPPTCAGSMSRRTPPARMRRCAARGPEGRGRDARRARHRRDAYAALAPGVRGEQDSK